MQLLLLGRPRLVTSAGTHALTGYGALTLAWLALASHNHALPSRVRLARSLWPDETDDQARKRLTNALYRLKKEFPSLEGNLIADANTVRLQDLQVDALEFDRLLRSTDPNDRLAGLELYQGDLLEDDDAAWLEEWRSQLRERFLAGTLDALEQLESQSDTGNAIRLAQRLVANDPLSEDAHTRLIRLYAASNRNSDAIQHYQTLEHILRQELGVTPRRETQAFVGSLRPNQSEQQAYRSLVGRSRELQALADQLAALRAGHGGVIVIEGEPGLGKTRLLEEIAQLARWHTLTTLRGAASEQHETPYAPLDAATQHAGTLLELATPLMRETLKPLLEPASNNTINSSSSAVAAALERWIGKLGEPLLLLLDDLQWAGDLFWALLPTLARLAHTQRMLLVVTHRSQEIQNEPFALEALTNLRREGPVLHLELNGLSQNDCATLAKAAGKTLEANELERLYRLSAGNPLVFNEFLHVNISAQHLEELLRSRFERLDARAQKALQAASVLGNTFEQSVWAAMLDFVPPVQRLIDARFLHQDGEQLMFQHDLIRSRIYEQQRLETRQEWHAKALAILQVQQARASVLAHHALEADQLGTAVPLLRKAAEEAMTFGAHADANRHTQQALANLHFHFDQNEAIRLRLIEIRLTFMATGSGQPLSELEEFVLMAQEQGHNDIMFNALLLKLDALLSTGDKAAFEQAGTQLIDLARAMSDLQREVQALSQTASHLAMVFMDPRTALPMAEQAMALCRQTMMPVHLEFTARTALLTCLLRLRHIEAAKTLLNETHHLWKNNPRLAAYEPQLLFFPPVIALLENRQEDALELFKEQLEAYRITGNIQGINRSLNNKILILNLLGQYGEAAVWAEEFAERSGAFQAGLDPNRTATELANLVGIHAFLGNTDLAESLYKTVIEWLEAGGTSNNGAMHGWETIGQLRREQGRFCEAYDAFQKFRQLRENLPPFPWVYLYEAEVACHIGLIAEAREMLEKAAPLFANYDHDGSKVMYHYTRYLIDGNARELEAARMIVLSFAATLKNPRYRHDVIHSVVYNKDVLRHWQQQELHTVNVSLGLETREITWTLDSGASDREHLLETGKVGLRQHRLKRLTLEAAAQGAIPTQADLAEALGVTLRTIESDVATLREQGVTLRTLGMKRELA